MKQSLELFWQTRAEELSMKYSVLQAALKEALDRWEYWALSKEFPRIAELRKLLEG